MGFINGLISPPSLSITQKSRHMTHEFKTALAKMYGIEEAILIHNFYHWITENKANNRNFFDGRFWTYNSQKAYTDLFPYMNEGKIKRTINNLVEKKLLMKGNHNANQYDRTNWYAFTDEGLSIVQNYYIDWSKMANGKVENSQPIPNNKPNNKPYKFIPSDEGMENGLFNDAETSTMTMLSSEQEILCAPRNNDVSSEVLDEQFEDLWLMYERKGSKAKAKQMFAKLTDDEVTLMRSHIPAYLQSRPERQYRLDFERYIKNKTFTSVVYSKDNTMLFDPETRMTMTLKIYPDQPSTDSTITINGVTYR